jgi:hypothetical protein
LRYNYTAMFHDFKEKYWPWYRINILEGVNPAELDKAKGAASDHKDGALPKLRYTEQNPAWALLYGHIKTGQIRPEDIRHMRRVDLEYLSGMSSDPPGLTQAEAAKLRENVARATGELNRRNLWRVSIVSALVGAIIGALATRL